MTQLHNESEIQVLIHEYLSTVRKGRRFEQGAYVVAQDGRVVIEHDEGWSALLSAGSPPVLYSVGGMFSGEAGWSALMDWLRP